jgi:hypothetical protein
MPNWKSETIRLTAFLHAPVTPKEKWWETIAGGEPESKHYRPQDRFLAVTGPVFDGECNLSLTGNAERIDWILSGRDDPNEGENRPFPFVGPFSDRIEQFRVLMTKWLSSAPAVKRLAFGAVVVTPVEAIAEGFRVLQPLLSNIKLTPESFDFAYSINRPRASKAIGPALRINRLSKWNVMTLQRVRLIAALAPGISDVQQTNFGASINVARIEIDINTAADRQDKLPAKKLAKLVSELIDLGIEIIEKGDRP